MISASWTTSRPQQRAKSKLILLHSTVTSIDFRGWGGVVSKEANEIIRLLSGEWVGDGGGAGS